MAWPDEACGHPRPKGGRRTPASASERTPLTELSRALPIIPATLTQPQGPNPFPLKTRNSYTTCGPSETAPLTLCVRRVPQHSPVLRNILQVRPITLCVRRVLQLTSLSNVDVVAETTPITLSSRRVLQLTSFSFVDVATTQR